MKGLPNIDPETGIRYGIISQHSLNAFVLDDIYMSGTNLSYESAFADYEKELRQKYWGKNAHLVEESLESWCEYYQENDDVYEYESEGVHVMTSDLGIFVLKSPVVVRAKECSPCCPNAGDLDSLDDGGFDTYGLPANWLEKE